MTTPEELEEIAEEFYKVLDPEEKERLKQKWIKRETDKLQMKLPLVRKVRMELEDEQDPLLLGC